MEFKRLSDVEVVAEPAESANVLIEEDGVIKKAPKTAVGGSSTEWDAVIEFYNTDDDDHITLISGDYNTVYNKIMVDGEVPNIMIRMVTEYGDIAYNNVMAVNVGVVESDTPYIAIPRPATIMLGSTGIYWRWMQDNTLIT